MKCFDYRVNLHHLLDIKQADHMTPEMEEHLAGCARCQPYTRAMKNIDAQLRSIPDIEISPELDAKLHAIPERFRRENPPFPWRPDLWRLLVISLPVAILALASILVSLDTRIPLQALITALTFAAIVRVVMQRPDRRTRTSQSLPPSWLD